MFIKKHTHSFFKKILWPIQNTMLSAPPVFFRKLFILSSFLISLLALEQKAWSYNFLYINPTTGAPIGWEPGTTIHYYVDPGSLGRLTNEQARTLIRAAMDIWENASPYANTPRFVYEGLLPEDVNSSNYQNYVSHTSCNTSDLSACPTQIQRDLKTVIIFDDDGSILSDLCSAVGGCGGYGGINVSSTDPEYLAAGYFIMSGTALRSSLPGAGYKIDAAMGVFVHELGHLLGLAHTSVNQWAYINYQDGLEKYLPTMFFAMPSAAILTNKTQVTLAPDDIAGITTLYPTSTAASNTGTIKGIITKADGSPMYYANIVTRNNDDPFCEAYSFLSGRSCAFNTTCNIPDRVADAGYIISALPSNTYTLEVEEISGIDNQDLSISPGQLDPFITGDAEFWNMNDIAAESSSEKTLISLAAGETKENINIVLNRSTVTEDRIQYIPSAAFTPGLNTRCPTSPPINYAALIGVTESTPSPPSPSTPSISSSGCSLIPE